MANDFGKAALIAGIVKVISGLWAAAGTADADVGLARDSINSVHVTPAAKLLFFSIVLLWWVWPVLLFILYRTRVAPALDEGLRRAVLVLAVISVADVAVFSMGVWQSVDTSASGHFFSSPVRHTVFDALEFSDRVAMIFFLLALSRQAGRARAGQGDGARLVRKVSLFVSILGTLVLAGLVGYLVFGEAFLISGGREALGTPDGVWIKMRGILFQIPAMIALLIVYAGLRNPCLRLPVQTVAATGLD